MYSIATLITRIFEPIIILPLITIIIAERSVDSTSEFIQFLLIFLFGLVGVPVLLLLYALKTNILSNWDITVRKQRIIPLFLLICLTAIFGYVIHALGYREMGQLLFHFFVFLCGILVITTKWKISMHTSANAFATGYMLQWFGLSYWPILIIVPLVGWSRVVRKNHTIAQAVAGALYGWVVVIFWLMIFK